MIAKRWLIPALLTLSIQGEAAEQLRPVPQEVYRPPQAAVTKDAVRAEEVTALAASRARARRLVPLSLPALGDEEREALLSAFDRQRISKIGVNRRLEQFLQRLPGSEDMVWETDPDGSSVGSLAIASTDAKALRSQLVIGSLPAGGVVRFWGSEEDAEAIRVVDAAQLRRRGGRLWSPVTRGAVQYIEIVLPMGFEVSMLQLTVRQISHLVALPGVPTQRDLFDLGASQRCNVDVNCKSSTLVDQMADATVKLVFTSQGGTFLCSGTLLADTDTATFVPYLYTAAHCLGTQSEASTLETYWFFESTFCNSRAAAPFSSLFGGAQLLYADGETDVSLLRLNDQPPSGAVFSGWDPLALAFDPTLYHIHHPAGDLKSISLGEFLGNGEPNQFTGDRYIRVQWDEGITESGSSGGGLFTIEGNNFFLRGGLWGGSSSCFNRRGEDLFSRFDLAYPNLSPYLDATVDLTPSSGKWVDPGDPEHAVAINVVNNQLLLVGNLERAPGTSGWMMSRGTLGSTSSYRGELQKFFPGEPATGGMVRPPQLLPIGEVTVHFDSNDSATLNWRGGSIRLTFVPG